MNKQVLNILLLALLAVIPQSITGQIYNSSASQIAASIGLSLDEASWFNTLNTFGLLIALPLGAWLASRFGYRQLFRIGAVVGLFSTLASSLCMQPAPQMLSWFGHGLSASFLVLFAHAIILKNLNFRAIAYAESLVLLVAVLVPLGIYPYLLSILAENNLWRWSFSLQLVPFLLMLGWARFGHWPHLEETQEIGFNWLQALLLTIASCGIAYILLRGERFDWFETPSIIWITLITASAITLLGLAIKNRRGRGQYLEASVLASRIGKLSMLQASIAGFVVLAISMLTSVYMTKIMQYSAANAGYINLIGFVGMLAGLGVALFATCNPDRNPFKVVPIGIIMMIATCIWLTGSNALIGQAYLWPAILLKGFAIGILNITLTIHILRSLPRQHLLETIAWFYLFRNLGSLSAIGEFSRFMTIETSNAMQKLAENYDPLNETFIHHQQLITASLQQSTLAPTPERSALLLMSQLKTQALSVAGVNNYQWLIATTLIIIPSMVLTMKWANHPARPK
ncbi:MFS transporter [Shewanella spartinae]|uniref:MFS transporter n=1 Tax=Shewanella spartinae TaxID=2864205 RepID=UPI001C657E63|nr:MFS transporter [Shewanella spartinae]QYJ95285.1 MFS transporter [Shewanella spartinae]